MGDNRDDSYAISRRRFLRVAAGAGAIIVGGTAFWPQGYAFGATRGTSPNTDGLPSNLGRRLPPSRYT